MPEVSEANIISSVYQARSETNTFPTLNFQISVLLPIFHINISPLPAKNKYFNKILNIYTALLILYKKSGTRGNQHTYLSI